MFKLIHDMIGYQLQRAIHYAPHSGTWGHLQKQFMLLSQKKQDIYSFYAHPL